MLEVLNYSGVTSFMMYLDGSMNSCNIYDGNLFTRIPTWRRGEETQGSVQALHLSRDREILQLA